MSYERFAFLYDELMADAPYDQWVAFTKKKLARFDVSGKRMLDLACGTGELSVRFANEGFAVTGVDLSAEMLSVARKKAEDCGLTIPLYQQDMAELEGLGPFDFIVIYCDSLNYLADEKQVQKTLAGVFRFLKKGGVLLFDVHSIDKINNGFINQTFTLNEDHMAYIWNSFPGEFPYSVEHELSFFVLDEESGKYDRVDELHIQRTFPIHAYSQWLKEAGFEIIEVNADFTETAPQPESERIFFSALKK
ncbi:class I SAM-dependent DNA methyltransferase [Neobacillus sp. SM06]|uniref:class I SAM-dependent DNA methyltransferase n=1 Tax=Neobacillus sp. SM06 TaxID=3422492 RepID=UPI003D295427